ncbi:MAG: type II secretion system protein [Candidatus Paceibacterota bacterium]|jgi:prepilin-type N-terminal cleavage/methylation domain-containing protein
MNKNKGFTLIELLVVIAIIGILASVVLASLNSARNKGADAAIKSGLANMRAQAEIYYDNNSGYSSAAIATLPVTGCTTATSVFVDTTMATAITNLGTNGTVTCVVGGASGSKADKWAMSVTLKAGGSWCVDSLGQSKNTAAASTGSCA